MSGVARDLAIAALGRAPPDGWVLTEANAVLLSERLDRRFRQSEVATEELNELLKLVAILRNRPGSAEAAERLVQAIREAPAAFERVRSRTYDAEVRARHMGRRFVRFEDRPNSRSAPMWGPDGPRGTLRLGRFGRRK
jgi:hypothetical protein